MDHNDNLGTIAPHHLTTETKSIQATYTYVQDTTYNVQVKNGSGYNLALTAEYVQKASIQVSMALLFFSFYLPSL